MARGGRKKGREKDREVEFDHAETVNPLQEASDTPRSTEDGVASPLSGRSSPSFASFEDEGRREDPPGKKGVGLQIEVPEGDGSSPSGADGGPSCFRFFRVCVFVCVLFLMFARLLDSLPNGHADPAREQRRRPKPGAICLTFAHRFAQISLAFLTCLLTFAHFCSHTCFVHQELDFDQHGDRRQGRRRMRYLVFMTATLFLLPVRTRNHERSAVASDVNQSSSGCIDREERTDLISVPIFNTDCL